MRLKKGIYLFWGIMDLLGLISYAALAINDGRVPFITDIIRFQDSITQYGAAGGLVIWMIIQFMSGVLLRLTLFYSAWSFICKTEINTLFFMFQEMLRIITFTASIPFLILLVTATGTGSAGIIFFIFAAAEILKIASIVWCKKYKIPRA
ncbi:hypothetical protein AC791_00420 [Klebsiella sp. RIT-PI-d]|uniref:hypothetical protein n=1 Tax=Klebsiella sp. RIT-PI-d TaxID=1681196 RepID=UPI0006764828|nr:hypothetical protein [Klebsiella sp. RIT-PI-d]KNC13028.1 hypothetical protein AC791_00420 [Klebsiella sp. RIT-PI-d]